MPTPDTNGLPPFADFEMMKAKINELVAKYNNLLVNLDSLNVVSLTADNIDAGTIDANVVTIRSDLSAGAYVQINGNGMVINNGSFNTFTADINGNVTMTRALIQSSPSSYPRIVMDPNSQLFGAYKSATENISITASDLTTGSPTLSWSNSAGFAESYVTAGGRFTISGSSDVLIQTLDDLYLYGGSIFLQNLIGSIFIPSWSSLVNSATSQSLQSALNAKATSGALTSSAGGASLNGGIAPGTQLLVAGGGSVTWSGINVPDHTHVQI